MAILLDVVLIKVLFTIKLVSWEVCVWVCMLERERNLFLRIWPMILIENRMIHAKLVLIRRAERKLEKKLHYYIEEFEKRITK